MNEEGDITFQKGFQEDFLRSPADIVIGGGAAGAGKTFAALMKPILHDHIPNFGAVFFRRTYPQLKNVGAIWDQSKKLYPVMGAKSNETEMSWTFPSKAVVRFSHLQHEKNVEDHQGSEYAMIIFDELTHFTERMFWYLLSRNRSTCGVKPKMLATCNPDPDSFVARLIEWWIDQNTGYPIPERSGKLRYFIRDNEILIWGNSKTEIKEKAAHIIERMREVNPEGNPDDLIKSLTFIPGSIYNNKELLKVDPGYLANLLAQDESTKARLLEGNWKIRQDNTSLFDFNAISDLYSNILPISVNKYITCDAARFGRDLCVIMVWLGWEVIQTVVLKKSDVHDIIEAIEAQRQRFRIPKSYVMVDQDGVGAGTVKTGGYRGFGGGMSPKLVIGIKENYYNFKTQCYYLVAERVNMGEVKLNINHETCIVDGVRSSKVKIGSAITDISELIRNDLRAIKRAEVDKEGKKKINDKEEQKAQLGRSPDFGDTIMMRAAFEFITKSVYL